MRWPPGLASDAEHGFDVGFVDDAYDRAAWFGRDLGTGDKLDLPAYRRLYSTPCTHISARCPSFLVKSSLRSPVAASRHAAQDRNFITAASISDQDVRGHEYALVPLARRPAISSRISRRPTGSEAAHPVRQKDDLGVVDQALGKSDDAGAFHAEYLRS